MPITKPSALEPRMARFHEALRKRKTTCVDSIRAELRRVEGYNKRLAAFVTVFKGPKGVALSRAAELDRLLSRRGAEASGLFGVPLAIKDNIFFAGQRTTTASFYFKDFVPRTTAEIVERAVAEGCVPLGKTNLHELALGATSTSSYFGPVRHPLDPTRIAGGSSGGSAVAVAMAGGPLLGLGTDTGGSTRVPASLCGVIGFKPTIGRLSLEGVFPLSPTLDHIGLLTKTMPDMVSSFESLTGERVPAPPAKMRVAVLTGYFLEGAERAVLRNFWRAIDRMRGSERFEAVEVEAGPEYAGYGAARVTILLKEASWFYEQVISSRDAQERMSADVLTLLRRGLRTSELRYFDANLVRLEAMNALGRVFKEVDIVAVPTTRIRAPKLSEVTGKEAGEIRQLLLRNVEVFNLCGVPAVSVPSNPGRDELPTGLQLACPPWEDFRTLLAGAEALKEIAR